MNNEIGALINYKAEVDIVETFRKAREMGLKSCQLCIWNEEYYGKEHISRVKAALLETDFKISTVWAGWDGPCEWNATYGPSTIGLVPPAYREARAKALIKASDFAEALGVKYIATHVGFIPINPKDPDFIGTAGALRYVCKYMKAKGQSFLFETGQETPITVVRMIEEIGTGNCGINFDTANLILYGMGNPIDAIDVFGKYIRDTHIKDGFFPTDTYSNGKQARVGEGRANIPEVIKKLRKLGYEGPFTIEREISGEQQQKDIAEAYQLLVKWMADADSEA